MLYELRWGRNHYAHKHWIWLIRIIITTYDDIHIYIRQLVAKLFEKRLYVLKMLEDPNSWEINEVRRATNDVHRYTETVFTGNNNNNNNNNNNTMHRSSRYKNWSKQSKSTYMHSKWCDTIEAIDNLEWVIWES